MLLERLMMNRPLATRWTAVAVALLMMPFPLGGSVPVRADDGASAEALSPVTEPAATSAPVKLTVAELETLVGPVALYPDVVLSSVLPVYDYPWRPGLEPAGKIVTLNDWLKVYASSHGAIYCDYHSAMADKRQGMLGDLASDGVHPNEKGYAVMAQLVERAIADALRRP